MDKSQTTLLRKQKKLKQEETGTKRKSPKIGNNIRVTVQPLRPQVRRWGEATVTKQLNGCSYEVQAENGHQDRRNRQFLQHVLISKIETVSVSSQ